MATAPKLDFGDFSRSKRVLHASQRQHQRAAKSLPLGVSDTYRYWGDDATIYVKRGKGALLWDLDGNRYVDFRLGWGPIILGYGDERVDRAARRGIEIGGVAALATELEASVAELMIEMVPSVEKVRFANSGSEAVATALRVARGYSGRDGFVMVEGAFHGMFDPVLWRTQMESWNPASGEAPEVVPFGKGIPKAHRDLVGVVPLNDADALEDLFKRERDRIGAFLMEPILGNCCSIASRQRYLHDVRLLCDKYDIVLIFDEVKTGFRVARGGAQELYGVRPDLSTFAKSMGNGYPIAALGGSAEIMKVISGFDGVMHGGTFTGHPVSLAAAEETLRILRDTDALLPVETWGRALAGGAGRGVPRGGAAARLHRPSLDVRHHVPRGAAGELSRLGDLEPRSLRCDGAGAAGLRPAAGAGLRASPGSCARRMPSSIRPTSPARSPRSSQRWSGEASTPARR